MSEYTKKYAKSAQPFDAPYGNKTTKIYRMESNAAGAILLSDCPVATALASGDTLILGVLVKGTRLLECLALVSNLFNATSTCKLGFKYVDGVDDSNVPQDADYFFAALALSAASRTYANNTAVESVVLPKDAYLYVTLGGADLSAAGVVQFLIDMIMEGPA